jgi:hypothetical protein
MAETEEHAARTIAASKGLQQKVGTGEIDPRSVRKAQDAMDNTKVDFVELARPYLRDLSVAIAAAHMIQGTLDRGTREKLSVPIMNLKANAGAFNYGLVSTLSGIVLNFLEAHEKPGKKTLQVVELLNKTIMLLVGRKMNGDCGMIGQALEQAFQDLCRWCVVKES